MAAPLKEILVASFDRLRRAFPDDLLEQRYQKFRFAHDEHTLRETPRRNESPVAVLIERHQ